MANPHRFYLSHMHEKTGFRATWDPGRPLQLGQVGKLDRYGVFIVYTTLQKEGIPVEIAEDQSSIAMDYTSHNSVSITTKAAGAAPVAGSALTNLDAGFNIELKSSRAIVFQTDGHTTGQITNIAEIEKLILRKYDDGNWDEDWLVVTHLVTADTGTVIISNSNNTKLDLKASANVGTANLKLTDASLGLSVAREQGSTLKYITQKGLTPLFRLMGINDPWFGEPSLRPKSLTADTKEFRIRDFQIEELEGVGDDD